MSRWDDASFDNEKYNTSSDNEETRLLKKFEDYKDLEKTEFEKRNSPQIVDSKKSEVFGRYFHALVVIQGIVIAGFVTTLMFIESINSEMKFSILSLATVVLSAEIVFISIYFRKKSSIDVQQKSSLQFKNRNEFDRI